MSLYTGGARSDEVGYAVLESLQMPPGSRRPLKTRERRWPRVLAARLAARGVRPNAVSLASLVFAALAGAALWLSLGRDGATSGLLLLAAAALVQLRLLCNLLDGLIAVEGGLGSPEGEIYNDLPTASRTA